MRRTNTAVTVALLALCLAPPLRADTVGPDVEPELPVSVYAKRREKLMNKLGDCVGALKAAKPADGSAIDPYFYYLTGVKDEGAFLLLAPRESIYRETLLFKPRDAEAEIWVGYRETMSPRLQSKYEVDYVGRIRGATPRGLTRAFRHSRCYADLRPAFAGEPSIPSTALAKYLKAFDVSTRQKWQALESMRAVHDDEELLRMDKAIAITFEGHRAAVRRMAAGVTERQVAGDIESAFYDAGGTGVAFPSIVATGENGAVLHWRAADTPLGADDLVVIDIGASYGEYAADITRTWPVSGKFTDEQAQVYETVLAIQQKVIDAVKPGVSLDKLHRIAEQATLDAGYELPHGIGHFVGLEVHDVGDSSAPLEAGMVITVEPGIYIQGKFGIRIEDMIQVTERGHRHMSVDLPRTVDEIEQYMAQARK
jgi:Xaa-Pro aminopeptidase